MKYWMLAAVTLCALIVMPCHAAAPKRPNVLFLFSDDQRFDTIHALGNDQIRTPNIDRLARAGFVFRNNYVMGSMSGAVCYPSRAMLHSGCTLWRTQLDLKTGPLWGAAFGQAGYETFGTGKWHNGRESFARAFARGKSVFFGGMSDHFKVPVCDLEAGQYGAGRTGEKFSSELFADAAIEFLRGHRGGEPFFLYVAFTAPHDPRTPPGEYATMYDPAKIRLPKNFLPRHPFDNGELWVRDEMLAPHPRTPEIVRQHIADYYGMITHMDAQIGRILQTLRQTGHDADTLIFFAADNGLAVGRHGLMGKQSLYEHSDRMPLIFAGPGIRPGNSDALVYLLDLFPTACELSGVPVPQGVEGKSLVPVLRGAKDQVRDYLFGAYRDVQRMVRDMRWKLIKYHVGGVKTVQLFDLAADPWETKNLADDPTAAGERSRLEALLVKARREFDDPIDFEGEGGKRSAPPAKPKPKRAAMESPARQILARSGLPGGLCVQLGAADATIARQLGRTGRFVVEILEPDAARAAAASRAIQAESLYGLVSVDRHDFRDRLPYTEDLVNLLVVAGAAEPRAEEIRRVLCPRGWVVAGPGKEKTLRAAGFKEISTFSAEGDSRRTWVMGRKPWPSDIDVWTHARHAADGNAVSSDRRAGPPRRIRWVTGEEGATSRMVTAEGRNYYAGILARDSFNGLRLWQCEAPLSKRGPAAVVVGNRVYAVVDNRMVALQGTTGQIVRDYPEASVPREILASGGVLVTIDKQSVRALDAQDGRLLWRRAASQAQHVAVSDDAVFFLDGEPRLGQKRVAMAIGLSSGEVLWQRDDYPWIAKVQRAVCHGERLVYEISTLSNEKKGNQIQVVSAADGRPLWSHDFVPGMNHNKQARAMFVGDRLWVLAYRQGVALDPASGETREKWPAGHCHCFPPVATVRYLFSGEMALTDLGSGEMDANRITKAACGRDAGWVPANGLIYVFPKACMCWPMLRGNAALATEEARADRQAEQCLLESGPAEPPSGAGECESDWPCYRQNELRSASTASAGPARLKRVWSVALGERPEGPIAADWADNPFVRGPITSPVIAGGRVYVARSDAHELVALDAASGKVLWRSVANGRIDSPPTIERGLCLFGTRMGWVYCLRADDGRLVWRLRAAPRDARIVAHGQVESPWPVPGSVLVSGGLAFFAAGRHPLADGGMHVYAVEPASGKIAWQKRLDTLPTKDFYASCSPEFECVDLLSRESQHVAMSRWLFDRRDGSITTKEAEAFAVVGQRETGAVVPRGSWTYGPRQNRRHPRDYARRPLLAFRGNRVFGCGGDFQTLFRRDFTEEEVARFDRKWITGWTVAERGRKGNGAIWPVERLAEGAKWSARPFSTDPPGQRIAAVVLAGEAVFVAGLEGGLVAISADDGRELGRCDCPAAVWDGLAAAAGKLFLSAADGTLVCYGE